MLPPISLEQAEILQAIATGSNVVVDAVAGSGKTSTVLHIAKALPLYNILLLTYNRRLKEETRDKIVQFETSNVVVHNYHSFGIANYQEECYTDNGLIKIVSSNKSPCSFAFDLIVIDEAQDMTPTYYKFVEKIMRDNMVSYKLAIIGDKNQAIFDFNKADPRFITLADKIFDNGLSWTKCHLSQSFRITSEMADFINLCLLTNAPSHKPMVSHKISGHKPRYLICNTFSEERSKGTTFWHDKANDVLSEVKYYFARGYNPSEIFILAPSIRSRRSAVCQLENRIKTELSHIQCFTPTSDDAVLDDEVIKGKLVFATFHQVKGLERKVAIVFSFDESYFKYYCKKDPTRLPNTMYVAITRASERLTVLHQRGTRFMPFVNTANLTLCTTMIGAIGKIRDKAIKIPDLSVTDLLRHQTQSTIETAFNMLIVEQQRPPFEQIEIKSKITNGCTMEEVSCITGTALHNFAEYKLKDRMTILDKMKAEEFEDSKLSNKYQSFSDDDIASLYKHDLRSIDLSKLRCSELLYIANCWNSNMSGYKNQLCQITNYDWLTPAIVSRCHQRILSLGLSKETIFEERLETEIHGRRLVGVIDAIDATTNKVYEFKCTACLKQEHYLQLACYMYLLHKPMLTYYLYNILSDELQKITTDRDTLEKIIIYLIDSKNIDVTISDEEFLDSCIGGSTINV